MKKVVLLATVAVILAGEVHAAVLILKLPD
jgi:hypothetical protein